MTLKLDPPTYCKEKKTTIGSYLKVVENHLKYYKTGWNIVEKNHSQSYDFFSS